MLKQEHFFFFAPYQFANPKYESKLSRQWRAKRLTDALSLIPSICFPAFVRISCLSAISRDSSQLEKRISITHTTSRKRPRDNRNISALRILLCLLMTGVKTTEIIHFGKHENQQSNNVCVRG